MGGNREWMYSGWKRGRPPSDEWVEHTKEFLDRAFSLPSLVVDGKIKCPCSLCRNFVKHKRQTIEMHLCREGFKDNYNTWTSHGEWYVGSDQASASATADEDFEEVDRMDDMLDDIVGDYQITEEEPTPSAQAFYKMVASADERVHSQTMHSRLSTIARLLSIKSQYNMPAACYDDIMKLIHELIPNGSKLEENFYQSKRTLEGLGMPYQKIHVCYNNCMLYYKENAEKVSCDICGMPRYEDGPRKIPRKVLRYLPIIPRLQRLYANEEIAIQMRWHKESRPANPNVMLHPCHGEAWAQFDEDFPPFTQDPRNVRLGLATDGFSPFGQGAAAYSCWPVFVVPYNLPPNICMKSEFIFLALVVPGKQHPEKNLNVMLEPLVDESLKVWEGVTTWDSSRKENFTMKAAYLWSIHDFRAYGDFTGWSTNGILSCPVCMCESKSFRLVNGGKPCWFDCHRCFLPSDHEFRTQSNAFRKDTIVHDGPPRIPSGEEVLDEMNAHILDTKGYGTSHNWKYISCFWRLPYFRKLKLRHNLDLMHTLQNVGLAVWTTCFDIPDKTKDNVKARHDVEEICDRPWLHLELKANGSWHKPKAPYCINRDDKMTILRWLKELKFPDGYAANISRGVNFPARRVYGMKSHDYHIFMQCLLPSAFRGFLPESIWVTLAELSFFFRQLCAKELNKEVVSSLEQNIPILMCKLEKIFPPGFFNCMEHVMVHLPYEARLGGPVQHRWMYRFERCINKLKRKIRNKAHPEGSLVEAHLVEEATNQLSRYFRPTARSRRNKAPRYDDGTTTFESSCDLSIFKYPGRYFSPQGHYDLTDKEYKAAYLYVMTNMPEMDHFFEKFEEEEWRGRMRPTQKQIDDLRLNGWKGGRGTSGGPNFLDWFKNLCKGETVVGSALRQMSYGFHRRVTSYGCYDINGYRFRSEKYEDKRGGMSTRNTGVCVRSVDENDHILEYYGVIEDILKLTWEGSLQLELVLFRCRWFDPTQSGVRRTRNLGLTEVKHTSRLSNFDPFVLAHQVKLVYYLPYACTTRKDLCDWWIVHQVSPRDRLAAIEMINMHDQEETGNDAPIFQADGLQRRFEVDPGADLEVSVAAVEGTDEITDPMELDVLRKNGMKSVAPELQLENEDESAPSRDAAINKDSPSSSMSVFLKKLPIE